MAISDITSKSRQRKFIKTRRNIAMYFWTIMCAYHAINEIGFSTEVQAHGIHGNGKLKYNETHHRHIHNNHSHFHSHSHLHRNKSAIKMPLEDLDTSAPEYDDSFEIKHIGHPDDPEYFDSHEGHDHDNDYDHDIFDHKYDLFEIPGLNCTPPGIDDFPRDLFTQGQRQKGAVLIHFLVSIYLFYALDIICEIYFCSSLESICDNLNMEASVAGATFMAVGTSAPELFTNVIGTFVTRGDVGIGTIVGSAVFNILVICALCGIAAKEAIKLEWWSVSRDCLCYSISVILLICVIRDEKIYWWEAMILVLVYGIYIIFMFMDSKMKKRAERLLYKVEKSIGKNRTETTYTTNITGANDDEPNGVVKNGSLKLKNGDVSDMEGQNERKFAEMERDLEGEKKTDDDNDNDDDDYEYKFCSAPHGEGCKTWFQWVIGYPIRLMFALTIPDCRKKKWAKYYPLTFIICVLWIAILAWVINWMMTIIGHTLQIPDSVMGLTFIAAGTSVPEIASSLIVARRGLGSMALSNSIGSNTFDILLCLGLPWLIRTIIISSEEDNYIQVNSRGIEYSIIMLASSLVILYCILAFNKFKLTRKVGGIALVLYLIFLTFACLFELNVFFTVNLPTCIMHKD